MEAMVETLLVMVTFVIVAKVMEEVVGRDSGCADASGNEAFRSYLWADLLTPLHRGGSRHTVWSI